jgi:hypothetical protein
MRCTHCKPCARLHLSKHIRQVAEQVEDKVMRLRSESRLHKAAERKRNGGAGLVLLHHVDEGLLLPQLEAWKAAVSG